MKGDFLNWEIVFTTNNYACSHGLSLSAASKQLNRHCTKHMIEKITRGIWANIHHPNYSPLVAVPYLLGKEQGYISFLTALHSYGMISQIPIKIQVATTGHIRKLISPIGHFEFIHLAPHMMKEGIRWSDGKSNYLIASPEKALLDTLYISTRKGNRFSSLPELDLEDLNVKQLRRLIKTSIKSKAIKIAIEKYMARNIKEY